MFKSHCSHCVKQIPRFPSLLSKDHVLCRNLGRRSGLAGDCVACCVEVGRGVGACFTCKVRQFFSALFPMDGAEFLRRELGVVVRLLCTLLTGKGLESLQLTRSLIFVKRKRKEKKVLCGCGGAPSMLFTGRSGAETITSYPFVKHVFL